jgi:hypothetical protein
VRVEDVYAALNAWAGKRTSKEALRGQAEAQHAAPLQKKNGAPTESGRRLLKLLAVKTVDGDEI